MDRFKASIARITKIFFQEQKKVIAAAMTLIILRLITKISGMFVTVFIATEFGASREIDIFNAANVIPEMLTNVILIGAISGAIIPVLIKINVNEKDEYFSRFFSTLLNLGIGIFIIVSILIMIFSPSLVNMAIDYNIISPQQPFSPGEIANISSIMRLLMIPQIILGISAFVSSLLNVYERFIIPSLAPLFYNVGRIIGVLVLTQVVEQPIFGLLWGTYIGALLHLAIQIPLFRHLGMKYKPIIDLRIGYIKDVLTLALPRVISLAAENILIAVNQIIALSLRPGSITVYNYALSLIQMPISLFGHSYAVAAFPSLSKLYENNDSEGYSQLFRKMVNQILFFIIPITVIIIVLRLPLTRIFYGFFGGEFNWDDTKLVAWVVLFFGLGLPFETLRALIYRVYYSLHDSFIPSIISFVTMIFGVVLSIGLRNYFSHYSDLDVQEILRDLSIDNFHYFFESSKDGLDAVGGLALSFAIVFVIEFIVLYMLLYRKKFVNNLNTILVDMIKKALVGLLLFIFTYLLYKLWENILVTSKTINLILLTGSTIIAVFSIYLWISYILKISEVDLILDYVIRHVRALEERIPFLKRLIRRD